MRSVISINVQQGQRRGHGTVVSVHLDGSQRLRYSRDAPAVLTGVVLMTGLGDGLGCGCGSAVGFGVGFLVGFGAATLPILVGVVTGTGLDLGAEVVTTAVAARVGPEGVGWDCRYHGCRPSPTR